MNESPVGQALPSDRGHAERSASICANADGATVGETVASDPIVLREATAADLDAIWAIESAVFGTEAWSLELMRDELTAPHRRYLVLVDAASDVRGYGGLLAVGAEGDIQTIAVVPELRGQGWGRRLMKALMGEGRACGVRELFLEVRADNPVARSLYESLGFEAIAVRPRYYQPDNIDAVVMRCEMVGPA